MTSIYIFQDPDCITPSRAYLDYMGGAERFLVLWGRDLESRGCYVHGKAGGPPALPEYDLCIHSNVFREGVAAKRHLLWAGSWHAHGQERADVSICISEYFREKLGWDDALVIPPCIGDDLFGSDLDDIQPVKGRISCHSNPARHIHETERIASSLRARGVEFTWHLFGGNRLYSDKFHDGSYSDTSLGIVHHPGLRRGDLLKLIAEADVWVYPNFSDGSETFGVAPLEAMALGIPVVLPDREPFRSVDAFEGAFLAEGVDAVVDYLVGHLEAGRGGPAPSYPNVLNYRESVIFDRLWNVVEDLLGGRL